MKATDKKDNDIRELYFSDEFAEFYGMLQDKVKAGDKTYLFHNTDKWHTFKKNGLTCLYNYKRFIIRFDFNKVIGQATLTQTTRSGSS